MTYEERLKQIRNDWLDDLRRTGCFAEVIPPKEAKEKGEK